MVVIAAGADVTLSGPELTGALGTDLQLPSTVRVKNTTEYDFDTSRVWLKMSHVGSWNLQNADRNRTYLDAGDYAAAEVDPKYQRDVVEMHDNLLSKSVVLFHFEIEDAFSEPSNDKLTNSELGSGGFDLAIIHLAQFQDNPNMELHGFDFVIPVPGNLLHTTYNVDATTGAVRDDPITVTNNNLTARFFGMGFDITGPPIITVSGQDAQVALGADVAHLVPPTATAETFEGADLGALQPTLTFIRAGSTEPADGVTSDLSGVFEYTFTAVDGEKSATEVVRVTVGDPPVFIAAGADVTLSGADLTAALQTDLQLPPTVRVKNITGSDFDTTNVWAHIVDAGFDILFYSRYGDDDFLFVNTSSYGDASVVDASVGYPESTQERADLVFESSVVLLRVQLGADSQNAQLRSDALGSDGYDLIVTTLSQQYYEYSAGTTVLSLKPSDLFHSTYNNGDDTQSVQITTSATVAMFAMLSSPKIDASPLFTAVAHGAAYTDPPVDVLGGAVTSTSGLPVDTSSLQNVSAIKYNAGDSVAGRKVVVSATGNVLASSKYGPYSLTSSTQISRTTGVMFRDLYDPATASDLQVTVDESASWLWVSYSSLADGSASHADVQDADLQAGFKRPQTHGRHFQTDSSLPDDSKWRVRPRGIAHGWTLVEDLNATTVDGHLVTGRDFDLYADFQNGGMIHAGHLLKADGTDLGAIPKWCIWTVDGDVPPDDYELPDVVFDEFNLLILDNYQSSEELNETGVNYNYFMRVEAESVVFIALDVYFSGMSVAGFPRYENPAYGTGAPSLTTDWWSRSADGSFVRRLLRPGEDWLYGFEDADPELPVARPCMWEFAYGRRYFAANIPPSTFAGLHMQVASEAAWFSPTGAAVMNRVSQLYALGDAGGTVSDAFHTYNGLDFRTEAWNTDYMNFGPYKFEAQPQPAYQQPPGLAQLYEQGGEQYAAVGKLFPILVGTLPQPVVISREGVNGFMPIRCYGNLPAQHEQATSVVAYATVDTATPEVFGWTQGGVTSHWPGIVWLRIKSATADIRCMNVFEFGHWNEPDGQPVRVSFGDAPDAQPMQPITLQDAAGVPEGQDFGTHFAAPTVRLAEGEAFSDPGHDAAEAQFENGVVTYLNPGGEWAVRHVVPDAALPSMHTNPSFQSTGPLRVGQHVILLVGQIYISSAVLAAVGTDSIVGWGIELIDYGADRSGRTNAHATLTHTTIVDKHPDPNKFFTNSLRNAVSPYDTYTSDDAEREYKLFVLESSLLADADLGCYLSDGMVMWFAEDTSPPPTITLSQPADQTVAVGGTLADVTASVSLDGEPMDAVTPSITFVRAGQSSPQTVAAVGTAQAGTFTLTFTASGNSQQTTVQALLVVEDLEAPEITDLDGAPEKIVHGGGYADAGVAVSDADGVSEIRVTLVGADADGADDEAAAPRTTLNLATLDTPVVLADLFPGYNFEGGSYNLSYQAFDRSGNASAVVARTVRILDVEPPTLSISAPQFATVGDLVGETLEGGAVAQQHVLHGASGSASGRIALGDVAVAGVAQPALDTPLAPSSQVTLFGAVTFTNTAPSGPFRTSVGGAWAPALSATDNFDQSLPVPVLVAVDGAPSATFTTDVLGTHTLRYAVSDAALNEGTLDVSVDVGPEPHVEVLENGTKRSSRSRLNSAFAAAAHGLGVSLPHIARIDETMDAEASEVAAVLQQYVHPDRTVDQVLEELKGMKARDRFEAYAHAAFLQQPVGVYSSEASYAAFAACLQSQGAALGSALGSANPEAVLESGASVRVESAGSYAVNVEERAQGLLVANVEHYDNAGEFVAGANPEIRVRTGRAANANLNYTVKRRLRSGVYVEQPAIRDTEDGQVTLRF